GPPRRVRLRLVPPPPGRARRAARLGGARDRGDRRARPRPRARARLRDRDRPPADAVERPLAAPGRRARPRPARPPGARLAVRRPPRRLLPRGPEGADCRALLAARPALHEEGLRDHGARDRGGARPRPGVPAATVSAPGGCAKSARLARRDPA